MSTPANHIDTVVVSVVLMHCEANVLSSDTPRDKQGVAPDQQTLTTRQDNLQTELTEASKALLYGEVEDTELSDDGGPTLGEPVTKPYPSGLTALLGLVALAILGVAGILLWNAWSTPNSDPAAPITPGEEVYR